MAAGLGFANKPQATSPVVPDEQHRRTPPRQSKFVTRRTPYYWQMQNTGMTGSYGGLGYGFRRWKKNNDSGPVPSAYLQQFGK